MSENLIRRYDELLKYSILGDLLVLSSRTKIK
jgi:hypothetical protein